MIENFADEKNVVVDATMLASMFFLQQAAAFRKLLIVGILTFE